MNMPGFTAEASIYRTRNYREMQVDGVSDAFEVVAARVTYLPWGRVKFDTPYCSCTCHQNGDWCACSCPPKTIVA
jgi:hypothetical protein